jgi:rRNA-processing protein FCF1
VKDLMIVDAANVMGSTPDGWWRDRRAAAERLRDKLSSLASGDTEIVMVVEGKAKDIKPISRVRVYSAPGSGDDAIVELVRAAEGRKVTVVTADRALRERVKALGVDVQGPRSIFQSG